MPIDALNPHPMGIRCDGRMVNSLGAPSPGVSKAYDTIMSISAANPRLNVALKLRPVGTKNLQVTEYSIQAMI